MFGPAWKGKRKRKPWGGISIKQAGEAAHRQKARASVVVLLSQRSRALLWGSMQAYTRADKAEVVVLRVYVSSCRRKAGTETDAAAFPL